MFVVGHTARVLQDNIFYGTLALYKTGDKTTLRVSFVAIWRKPR